MILSYTRAALKGMKRFTDDEALKTRIDGILVLSGGTCPAGLFAPSLVDEATEAYRRWSAHHRLTAD